MKPEELLSVGFALWLLATVALRMGLAYRQSRHILRHRGTVPEQFSAKITLESHQKAADYTVSKLQVGVLEGLLESALLIAWTLGGGLTLVFGLADQWAQKQALVRDLLFFGVVFGFMALIDLPFNAWRTFQIDQRFGFNRTSPRLFWIDQIKGLLLSALIGLPVLAVVLLLMRWAGGFWWLWVWLFWIGLSGLLLVLYPTVIAPWFNTFKPLDDPTLATRIHQLLARYDFRSSGLFVMDGSRRSSHGNAYFTGLGQSKRIVFFDTLLSRLSPDEIVAVLAHELGHFKHRHVLKRLLSTFVGGLVFLMALGFLIKQDWFYAGFGIFLPDQAQREAVALLLFSMLLPVVLFPLHPLTSALSRKHEFEADAFAASATGSSALVSALVKLYEDNASTLTPDPLYTAFYATHPPALQRIEHLLGLTPPSVPAQ